MVGMDLELHSQGHRCRAPSGWRHSGKRMRQLVPRGGSERALQMHPFSQSPSSVIKSEKKYRKGKLRTGKITVI